MWWIQKTPISATCVEVNVGYCFPEETTQRSDYDAISPRYVRRWDQVVEEDDLITVYQQKGLNEHVSGRYTPRERVVHEFDQKIVEIALRGGYA